MRVDGVDAMSVAEADLGEESPTGTDRDGRWGHEPAFGLPDAVSRGEHPLGVYESSSAVLAGQGVGLGGRNERQLERVLGYLHDLSADQKGSP